MGVVFDQMPNALQHKFLGIETHRITWAAFPLGKLLQKVQSGFVSDEEVKSPAGVWVRLQMVQEAVRAMRNQFPAYLVAASVRSPARGPLRLCPRQPICGRPNPTLGRGYPDGSEIGQQRGG